MKNDSLPLHQVQSKCWPNSYLPITDTKTAMNFEIQILKGLNYTKAVKFQFKPYAWLGLRIEWKGATLVVLFQIVGLW